MECSKKDRNDLPERQARRTSPRRAAQLAIFMLAVVVAAVPCGSVAGESVDGSQPSPSPVFICISPTL